MKKWIFDIILGSILSLIVIGFFAQAFYGYIIQDDDILVFNALIDIAFGISFISIGFICSVFMNKIPVRKTNNQKPQKEKTSKVSKKKLG